MQDSILIIKPNRRSSSVSMTLTKIITLLSRLLQAIKAAQRIKLRGLEQHPPPWRNSLRFQFLMKTS